MGTEGKGKFTTETTEIQHRNHGAMYGRRRHRESFAFRGLLKSKIPNGAAFLIACPSQGRRFLSCKKRRKCGV